MNRPTVNPLISTVMMLGLLLVPPYTAARQGADAPAPGTYRCSSYNVSGSGGSCRNMQPLKLNVDGSYQHSSTRGRWSVRGGKLLLSESKLWGAGEILGRDTLRFEYDYRDRRHVVTWVCQGCAVAGPPRLPAPATADGSGPTGAPIGVSLILRFDRAIGGVSSFVIVPVAHARGYTHNAPLPRGAVQGLARETGPTTVALTTNRDNRLVSGRRYVVFLSWPRETIPVAVLDLPAVAEDYSATLAATLDGAGVLARSAR